MRGEAISGPAKFWGEYIVQEVPFGTRVRKMGQIELDGLLQVAEVLGSLFQKALEQDLENLKRLLELQAAQHRT